MQNLPTTLWGRDLQSQMNLIMCGPNEIASKQKTEQDPYLLRGLGKKGKALESLKAPSQTLSLEVWGIFGNGHYLACIPRQ